MEEGGRMQMGYLLLQGEGGTAVNSNTKDIPKHCSTILWYLRKHKDAPALIAVIRGNTEKGGVAFRESSSVI